MEPVALANTLTSLFAKEGARAPTVEADQLGRRLIVRGTPDQLVQLKAILTGLGEGDGAPRDRSDRGTVRSLTLGGRDPEELLPLLKDAWSATRPNPIRIVVPSRPKPIRERSVPGADNLPPEANILGYCVLGGAVFGYGLGELRQIAKPMYRLGVTALLCGAVGFALYYWLDDLNLLGDEQQRMFLGVHLLLGIPFFYLLAKQRLG